MYRNKKIGYFINELSSKKPSPGGGTVAALSGCLGASLLLMAYNLTVNKKSYKRYRRFLKPYKNRIIKLKNHFLDLMRMDTDAYKMLAKAIKKKKKKIPSSRDSVEKLFVKAADVPLRICRASYEGMLLIMKLAEKLNRNLLSDIAISNELFKQAFRSANILVKCNLFYIKDKKKLQRIEKSVSKLSKDIEISNIVDNKLCRLLQKK